MLCRRVRRLVRTFTPHQTSSGRREPQPLSLPSIKRAQRNLERVVALPLAMAAGGFIISSLETVSLRLHRRLEMGHTGAAVVGRCAFRYRLMLARQAPLALADLFRLDAAGEKSDLHCVRFARKILRIRPVTAGVGVSTTLFIPAGGQSH